ncbi:uncharacterized protein C1orf53 homolog isoform X3 [Phyllopteryx taeniolatus]|uniref:uncharacterized protein C1orf53 homolog isoform X3 n=1 Tax=Phyllopteryx taeniolatus TaxID=161469 RepID=UPI002AD395B6|nr:uncharacterized protein C1orf53 homolog isoform X3 [Phyllopteryx taeniolatus]
MLTLPVGTRCSQSMPTFNEGSAVAVLADIFSPMALRFHGRSWEKLPASSAILLGGTKSETECHLSAQSGASPPPCASRGRRTSTSSVCK